MLLGLAWLGLAWLGLAWLVPCVPFRSVRACVVEEQQNVRVVSVHDGGREEGGGEHGSVVCTWSNESAPLVGWLVGVAYLRDGECVLWRRC